MTCSTCLAGSRQRWDQTTDLLSPRLMPLAWYPQAATPHRLWLSVCCDGGWKRWHGDQGHHRAPKHRSVHFLMEGQAPGLQRVVYLWDPRACGPYWSVPPSLPSQHPPTKHRWRSLLPGLGELPTKAYYRYRNMFIKPSMFELCVCCCELKFDGGPLNNKGGSSDVRFVIQMEMKSPLLHFIALLYTGEEQWERQQPKTSWELLDSEEIHGSELMR